MFPPDVDLSGSADGARLRLFNRQARKDYNRVSESSEAITMSRTLATLLLSGAILASGPAVADADFDADLAESRALAGQLGSQLGGVRAGIEQQAAAGMAAGYSNLGQNAGNFAQARAGIQSNIQYQGQQGLSESYGALGAAAGEILGGAADAWSSWASKRPKVQSPRGRSNEGLRSLTYGF
jgi:hypothetical protein